MNTRHEQFADAVEDARKRSISEGRPFEWLPTHYGFFAWSEDGQTVVGRVFYTFAPLAMMEQDMVKISMYAQGK